MQRGDLSAALVRNKEDVVPIPKDVADDLGATNDKGDRLRGLGRHRNFWSYVARQRFDRRHECEMHTDPRRLRFVLRSTRLDPLTVDLVEVRI